MISGTNAYAVLSSPRTSGTEAILLSASWLSQSGPDDGALNLRGVSTILALSAFLKRLSIVFLVFDFVLPSRRILTLVKGHHLCYQRRLP